MSDYASMVVPVSGVDTRGAYDNRRPWVRLEQVKPRKINRYLGMSLFHQMWLMAATGNSATSLLALGCPIEVRGADIYVFLDFWAWPSDPDLPFDLDVAHGRIINRKMARESREVSIFVNNSNVVELPYCMTMATATWLTQTYNRMGEIVPQPSITRHGSWLELSDEVFGVVKVRGIAEGESATVEMVINKPVTTAAVTQAQDAGWYDEGANIRIYTPGPTDTQQSFRVSNLQNTVTASWETEDGVQTSQLRLEVPPCVEDFLTLCPDNYQRITLLCTERYTLTVYYNACDGSVIRVTPTNPIKYCSKSVVAGASPFLQATSGWLL